MAVVQYISVLLALISVQAKLKLWPYSDGLEVDLQRLNQEELEGDECSSCMPLADSNEEDLLKVQRFNCERISKANTDFSRLAGLYGQAVDESWKTRISNAQKLCDQATNATDVLKQAELATCAWGVVLMRNRECCNIPGPPYCVSSAQSKWARASVLALAVFGSLLAAAVAKCCQGSFYSASLVRCEQPEQTSPSVSSTEPPTGDFGVYTAGEIDSLDQKLKEDLTRRWKGCTLVELVKSEPGDLSKEVVDTFAKFRWDFDFQEDSVKNQFEHFVSLWRSHCAAHADRRAADQGHLLERGLESLEEELLHGFLAWRDELEIKVRLRPGQSAVGALRKQKLENIVLYLLVWGEAGNLRFMPEMLYFITYILSVSTPPRIVHKGRSSAFLVDIVRPIYKVVFEEHHECVAVKSNKDAKKLREGFDTYLPADSANYDDWNELFMDADRLCTTLEWLQENDIDTYHQLKTVNWKQKLSGVKTHRELHSWWGVFAATHRLWFLHVLLYLLCMFIVSESLADDARGWKVYLAGNSTQTCLSCVGLLVPLHIFAWRMGSWFTTGSALRRHCNKVLVSLFWNSLALVSCATFLWVRYVDAVGHNKAWSEELLGVAVEWPFAIHMFVCCLGTFCILIQPFENGDKLRQVSPPLVATKLGRWCFWSSVLALKVWASFHGIQAIEDAITELKISRPGREALEDIPKFAFGPNWDKDVIQWLAIWGTGLLCFVADTQFWFVVGCSLLGFILACAERGGCWALKTFIQEDSIGKVPQRFSSRVSLNKWNRLKKHDQDELIEQDFLPPNDLELVPSRWFPSLWDLIIDFMRCEDKLDDFTAAQLKFSVTVAPSTETEKDEEPWRAMQRLCARKLEEQDLVMLPSIFTELAYGQRFIERHAGIIPSDSWPKNLEVQWRLSAFARNLGSNHLPRPFLTPYLPGLTVLIPHYGEQILMEKHDLKDLNKKEEDTQDVPLIAWLEKRYHDDFIAFTNRMKSQYSSWPDHGNNWDAYEDKHWKHICLWASMRSQTFWRTVEGCMLYLPALERFEQMIGHIHRKSKLKWDASAVFTCMGCMQQYAYFDAVKLDHADQLLRRFPRSFQIAYIGFQEKGPNWKIDQIHPKQERRYYSCLIDAKCDYEKPSSKRRAPRFTVELPGFPILGDGKGDNQNTGIIYTRGSIIQAIDSNQGGYFEQMLLLPCALGEFRRTKQDSSHTLLLNPRIVGFAEHITSDIGSLGDFAAGAETAFGTVLQRCYAFLGARMHYGHPDMMNKEFMIQQGGISKATKMLNLSEDIFAGMDFTLRGKPRSIVHREYLHVGKGRDLGFNSVLFFFAKLSQGTGEQLLTRQMFRLGHEMDLPKFLTFYYAHAGYYLTQFLLSKCIPMLVFIWLLVVLDDPEQNFPAMEVSEQDGKSGAVVIARMLITQFAWLVPFFLLAQTAPLFLQVWWEKHFLAATIRILKQIVTLAPLHFIFQAKVIGANITREITLGGAKYKATGRQLPTHRAPFIGSDGLYNDYAVMSLYDGAQLFLATILVMSTGGLAVDRSIFWSMFWWVFAVSLTIGSWLLAPFIFNPYQFTYTSWRGDFNNWWDFFFKGGGETWKTWYTDSRLCSHQPLRASSVEVLKRALFIGCLYTVANQKVHMLTVIFEGGQLWSIGMVILPPIFLTIVFIGVLRLIAFVLRCKGHEAVAVKVRTMAYDQRESSACLGGVGNMRVQDCTVRNKTGKILQVTFPELATLSPEHFPLSFTRNEGARGRTWGKWAYEQFHFQVKECTITIALPTGTALDQWKQDWPSALKRYTQEQKLEAPQAYEIRSCRGDLLNRRRASQRLQERDFPLSLTRKKELNVWLGMLLVIVLVPVEAVMLLWKFKLMGWHKSFVVGLLLKFSILSMVMELVECALHFQGAQRSSCCCGDRPRSCSPYWDEFLFGVRGSMKTWLYSHRMAQDFFVSLLIFLILSLTGTLWDALRKCFCGCETCGLHNVLIYRDPGGIHKRQERRTQQMLHVEESPHEAPGSFSRAETGTASFRGEAAAGPTTIVHGGLGMTSMDAEAKGPTSGTSGGTASFSVEAGPPASPMDGLCTRVDSADDPEAQ